MNPINKAQEIMKDFSEKYQGSFYERNLALEIYKDELEFLKTMRGRHIQVVTELEKNRIKELSDAIKILEGVK